MDAYLWLFVLFPRNVLKSGMNDRDFVCVCAYFKWLCQFLGQKKGLPFFFGKNWPFSCHIHSHVWHNLSFSTECSRITYECSKFCGDMSFYVLPYPFWLRDHSLFPLSLCQIYNVFSVIIMHKSLWDLAHSYFFWHTPVH